MYFAGIEITTVSLKDYIRGQRQGKEANKLERKAMDDPFLQDAIDGYDSVKGDHISAIEDLEKRLSSPHKHIAKQTWIWAAAAIIVLLIGIPFLLKLPTEKELVVASSEIAPKHPEITSPADQKDSAFSEDLDLKTDDSTIKKEDIVQNRDKELIAEATPPPAPKEESAKSAEQNTKRILLLEEQTNRMTEPVILSEAHAGHVVENIEVAQAREVQLTTDHDTFGITDIKKSELDLTKSLAGKAGGIVVSTPTKESNAKIRGTSTTPTSLHDQLLVAGRIVDETGEPLPGVSIFIPNTRVRTISDMAGNFHLFAPKEEEGSLLATHIGMNDVNIPLKENVGDIVMKANDTMLSEVVVVGYRAQKKVFSTGAIATVKTVSDLFGEEEFKKYFSENYDKEICTGQEITFVVEFFIDPAGRPGSIHIKENSCPALETEIRRLLLGSPLWSEANRKVNLRIEMLD